MLSTAPTAKPVIRATPAAPMTLKPPGSRRHGDQIRLNWDALGDADDGDGDADALPVPISSLAIYIQWKSSRDADSTRTDPDTTDTGPNMTLLMMPLTALGNNQVFSIAAADTNAGLFSTRPRAIIRGSAITKADTPLYLARPTPTASVPLTGRRRRCREGWLMMVR